MNLDGLEINGSGGLIPVKNESSYVRKFAALFKKLPAPTEQPPQRDAVTQMVIGFLQWEATQKQAEAAFKRLMQIMVDNNDLRISHTHQIIELIGPGYPRIEERVARMKDALQEIYVREHGINPVSLAEKNKKDIRAYFDSLAGMTRYVASQVMLLCYGAHNIPCDEKTAARFKAAGIFDAQTTSEQIEHFLERQIKAGDGIDAHLRLQAWSDESVKKPAAAKAEKPAKPKKAPAKKSAGKPKSAGKTVSAPKTAKKKK